MTLPDREVLSLARAMIKNYGAEAEIRAARRADEFMVRGDMDSRRVWLGILRAIALLHRTRPDDAEAGAVPKPSDPLSSLS